MNVRTGGVAGVALAAAGGAAAAFAHPPWGVVPGVFGFALVVLALETRNARRPRFSGFARGWAAGVGYLAVSTSWIGEPFLIDAAAHAWQAPFAIALMPGLIGLIWGVAGCAWAAFAPQGASRILVFASLFAAAEWTRGHLFTGFPWDLPGELWRAGSALSQTAALAGVYGASWLTLVVGAAPVLALRREAPAGPRIAVLAGVALTLAGLGLWGAGRSSADASGPIVRLVQPNLPEPPRWSEAVVDRAVDRYARLTALPGAPIPALVVWPEGAVPDSFDEYLMAGSPSRARIQASLRVGQTLLTGGERAWRGPSGPIYANSLIALDRTRDGLTLAAVYDKHHLVPFGEYMPLAALLEPLGLRKLISQPVDFTPGPPPRSIRAHGLRLQPLICYEALFPELAQGDRGTRPRALITVSDDAWFGRHAGPWQHFNLASYRAIEQGLPMARVTPTGVSGMIDAFGRPASPLAAPGTAAVIDAPLPPAIAPTLYARWGEAPFVALLILGLAGPALAAARRLLLRGPARSESRAPLTLP